MRTSSMMKRMAAMSLAAAAGLTAGAAAAADAAPEAQRTIQVLSVKGGDAASPQAAVWKKAPAGQVALQTAFPGHASIVGTALTQQMTAQAVRAGDRLFVKLAWRDATANTEIKDTDQFVDGAAVQFPVNGKDSTLAFMGDPENPVNVWHWRADGRTRNLVAKGFGTATPVPTEGLRSTAKRTRDGWEVVISRPLRVKADEGADLQGRRTMPIAFAAWDGENQERDGLKAVTMEWWQLNF